MSNPYIRIKCKSVQYLSGFIGYDFTVAFTPISIPGSPVSQNVRLERGETKLLDLEILALSSDAIFNPFNDTFKLESRVTESGSDETFPDNALTAFELSPPMNSGNHKIWTHEREQIIEETGGNQYTTPDATLKFVFEVAVLDCTLRTQQEEFIYLYRNQILAAANSQRDLIPPELIAAILSDELTRRDSVDDEQDRIAREIINGEGVDEEDLVAVIETLAGKPISQISFGPAQMQQGLVVELVGDGYIRQPDDWNYDRLDASLQLLESPEWSPYLVSAYLQKIIDFWRGGGDCPGREFENGTPMEITGRWSLIASLYHLGECGTRGVHPGAGPNGRGLDIEANMNRMGEILRCP